jgi:hypothetical protein
VRPWAAVAALALAACGDTGAGPPRAPPPPAAVTTLDCAKGFDALSAEIAAMPDLVQAPSPGEPYRFLNHRNGNPSFVVTLPDAPAHPAILMQSSAGGATSTSGCRWSDEASYEELVAYIRSLKDARGR